MRGFAAAVLLTFLMVAPVSAQVDQNLSSVRVFDFGRFDYGSYHPLVSAPYVWETENFDLVPTSSGFTLKQRPGYDQFISTSFTSAVANFIVSQVPGKKERIVMATAAGTYVTYSDNSFVQLDNSAHNVWNSVIQVYDTVVVTNGNVNEVYLIADTVIPSGRNLSGWKFPILAVNNGRVWGAGVADSLEHRVVYLPVLGNTGPNEGLCFTDPETTTGAGGVWVGRGDGDFINDMEPMGNDMVVYKSKSIWMIVVSPSTNKPAEVRRVLPNIGCWAARGACSYNNRQFFFAQDGIYEFTGTDAIKLSSDIDFWFADSLTRLSPATRYYGIWALQDKLYCYLPKGGYASFSRDVVWVYDLNHKTWAKYDIPFNFTGGAYAYRPSDLTAAGGVTVDRVVERLIFYDDAGDQFLMLPSNKSADAGFDDDGAAITSTVRLLLPSSGSMRRRTGIHWASLFARNHAANDTVKVTYYDQYNWGSPLDSSTFTLNGSRLSYSLRVPDGVTSPLVGVMLRISEANDIAVDALEFEQTVRGGPDVVE